eukprot:1181714-Prorocentrum_minimum.AAC.1
MTPAASVLPSGLPLRTSSTSTGILPLLTMGACKGSLTERWRSAPAAKVLPSSQPARYRAVRTTRRVRES